MNRMNRWYDKHKKLGHYIDKMKDMDPEERDLLISGILELIRSHSPSLLDHFVMNFPLDFRRKRWYDRDPYLWLAINGMKFGDAELLDAVTTFLMQEDGKVLEMSA